MHVGCAATKGRYVGSNTTIRGRIRISSELRKVIFPSTTSLSGIFICQVFTENETSTLGVEGGHSAPDRMSLGAYSILVFLFTFDTLHVGKSGLYFIRFSNYLGEQKYKIWARSAHGKCVKNRQTTKFRVGSSQPHHPIPKSDTQNASFGGPDTITT